MNDYLTEIWLSKSQKSLKIAMERITKKLVNKSKNQNHTSVLDKESSLSGMNKELFHKKKRYTGHFHREECLKI